MNIKAVEEYIPKAINIIKNEKNNLDKEFKGYISNFAASLRQNGLLVTVAFFGNTESSALKDRKKINDYIKAMLPELDNDKDLLTYLLDKDEKELRDLKSDIEEIVIALKLAIQLFVSKEGE